MGTRDQEYMDRTEMEVAIEYAEIAAKYDVPVTLFITGRAAVEESDRVKRLAAMGNVEIGGHNYWAFSTSVHKMWRVVEKATGGLVGSWNGPRAFQRFEIRRTIEVLNKRGGDVTAWRDHAYRHDQYTVELLSEEGITHLSDTVGPDEKVRLEDSVTVIPVNTPPDHEHIYHAFRTPESDAIEEFEGPFGGESVDAGEWIGWVGDYIETVDHEVMTVLAHPACMWLADEFEAFEEMLQLLDKWEENAESITAI